MRYSSSSNARILETGRLGSRSAWMRSGLQLPRSKAMRGSGRAWSTRESHCRFRTRRARVLADPPCASFTFDRLQRQHQPFLHDQHESSSIRHLLCLRSRPVRPSLTLPRRRMTDVVLLRCRGVPALLAKRDNLALSLLGLQKETADLQRSRAAARRKMLG